MPGQLLNDFQYRRLRGFRKRLRLVKDFFSRAHSGNLNQSHPAGKSRLRPLFIDNRVKTNYRRQCRVTCLWLDSQLSENIWLPVIVDGRRLPSTIMPVTLEQVTEEVRELSRPDREQLLARLIRDLEPVENLSAAEIESAWDNEIARRLEEVDSGKVKAVPAEEVFARIQAKLDEAR